MYQVVAILVHKFDIKNYLDEDDPFSVVLSTTAFTIGITYHTTLQDTPSQLLFGRNMAFKYPYHL